MPDQCKSILQITAAAGNRLAHPLFSELSRLGKRFHKSETTQSSLITLSGIVKVSHLLRPIRPGFMFSVPSTENIIAAFATISFFIAAHEISESIWGILLSQPLRIIGLSGYYPDNNLIRRSLILWRPCGPFDEEAFQHTSTIKYCSQFPEIILVHRAD